MKKYVPTALAAALMLIAVPVSAQNKATVTGVPEIPFHGAEFPEAARRRISGRIGRGGDQLEGQYLRLSTARDTTRLFEFDQNGNFIKEIGKGYYGFEFAHSVRVDKDDNIWTVDEGTNMVTKFSPDGKVLMVLGRRPPPVDGPVATRTGPNPPAQKYTFCRPTDVGWDPQGNIFVSDGYCNNRVVKYDKNGRFLAQAGSEKAGQGARRVQPAARLAGGRAAAMSGSPTAPTSAIRCWTTI